MSYDPADVVIAAWTEAEVSFGRSSHPGRGPAPAGPGAPLGPGKQTLTSLLDAELVQQRAAARAPEADVHAAAAHGTAGGATALPHLAPIQQAFGRHDVGGIRAHVGGAAAEGAAAMGATAFAVGDRVAFAGAPDLHTAAHEAAHVVQQRAGVQLRGGVGEAGDRYEQHAKVGLPANTRVYDMSGDELGAFDQHTKELAKIAVKQR